MHLLIFSRNKICNVCVYDLNEKQKRRKRKTLFICGSVSNAYTHTHIVIMVHRIVVYDFYDLFSSPSFNVCDDDDDSCDVLPTFFFIFDIYIFTMLL